MNARFQCVFKCALSNTWLIYLQLLMLCELRPIYKCDRLRANVRRQTCRRDEIRFSNLGGGARWEKLNPWRQPPAAHARLRKKAFYAQIDNFYIYRFAGTLKAFMYKLPEIMTLAGKHNLRSSAESECKISKPLVLAAHFQVDGIRFWRLW